MPFLQLLLLLQFLLLLFPLHRLLLVEAMVVMAPRSLLALSSSGLSSFGRGGGDLLGGATVDRVMTAIDASCRRAGEQPEGSTILALVHLLSPTTPVCIYVRLYLVKKFLNHCSETTVNLLTLPLLPLTPQSSSQDRRQHGAAYAHIPTTKLAITNSLHRQRVCRPGGAWYH